MRRLATAIAFVLVAAGAAAFVGTPAVTQDDQSLHASAVSSSDCPSNPDFTIVQGESNAQTRNLLGGEEKIGSRDVDAGAPMDLYVDLETSGDDLRVKVFHAPNGDCQPYDPGRCDENVTATGDEFICELEDPGSNTKTYWVHYENQETADPLDFRTWVEPA